MGAYRQGGCIEGGCWREVNASLLLFKGFSFFNGRPFLFAPLSSVLGDASWSRQTRLTSLRDEWRRICLPQPACCCSEKFKRQVIAFNCARPKKRQTSEDCCNAHICAYRPFSANSATCEPRSTMRPASSTKISCASTTVDKRCAITKVVLFCAALCNSS